MSVPSNPTREKYKSILLAKSKQPYFVFFNTALKAIINKDIKTFKKVLKITEPHIVALLLVHTDYKQLTNPQMISNNLIGLRTLLLLADGNTEIEKELLGTNVNLFNLTILSGDLEFFNHMLQLIIELKKTNQFSEETVADFLDGTTNIPDTHGIPLVFALCKNLEIAKRLLAAGAKLHPNNNRYFSVLNYFITFSKSLNQSQITNALQFLIDSKANVNYQTYLGSAPINEAVVFGSPETVALMLKANANPNYQDPSFYFPLLFAALRFNSEPAMASKVRLLIEAGARIDLRNKLGQTIFFDPSKTEHTGILQEFRQKIMTTTIDKTETAVIDCQNIVGQTVLHQSTPHPKLVTELLSLKANPYIRDKNADTPIDIAIRNNHFESLKILVEFGKYNLETPHPHSGCTPLLYAVKLGSLEIVRYLCDRRVNLKAVDFIGHNALMLATVCGHLDLVQFFLKGDFALNITEPMQIKKMKNQTLISRLNTELFDKIQAFSSREQTEIQKFHQAVIHTVQCIYREETLMEFPTTPFQFACAFGNLKNLAEIMQSFLAVYRNNLGTEFETFITGEDFFSDYLFTTACSARLEAVRALLEVCPQNISKNLNGITLLAAVLINQNNIDDSFATVQYLIDFYKKTHKEPSKFKAWINTRDQHNHDALYYASLNGHQNVVEFLLAQGGIVDFNQFSFLPFDTYGVLLKSQITTWMEDKYNQDFEIPLTWLVNYILNQPHRVEEMAETSPPKEPETPPKEKEFQIRIGIRTRGIIVNVIISAQNIHQVFTSLIALTKEKYGKELLTQKIKEALLDTVTTGNSEEKEHQERAAMLLSSFNVSLLLPASRKFDELNKRLGKVLTDNQSLSKEITLRLQQSRANIEQHHCFPKNSDAANEHQKKQETIQAELKVLEESQQKLMADLEKNYPLENLKEFHAHFSLCIKEKELDKAKKLLDEKQSALDKFFRNHVTSTVKLLDCQSKLKNLSAALDILLNTETAALKKSQLLQSSAPKSEDRKKSNQKRRNKGSSQATTTTAAGAGDFKQAAELSHFVLEQNTVPKPSEPSPYLHKLTEIAQLTTEYAQHLQAETQETYERQEREWGEQFKSLKITGPMMSDNLAPVLGRKPIVRNLDNLGQVSAKVDISSQMREIKSTLELKFQNENERFLETQLLRWNVILLLEALKRVHGGLFPDKVAKKMRDLLVYCWKDVSHDKQNNPLSSADLRKINENFVTFLSNPTLSEKINCTEVLLNTIDPSTFLLSLISSKEPVINLDFCEQQIEEGLTLWKHCQEIYQISQDKPRTQMVEMGLGIVFGTLGCAISHIEYHKKSLSQEDQKRVQSMINKIYHCTGQTQTQCIQIGKQFRHLDRVPNHPNADSEVSVNQAQYVSAPTSWRVYATQIRQGSKFAPNSTTGLTSPSPTTTHSQVAGTTPPSTIVVPAALDPLSTLPAFKMSKKQKSKTTASNSAKPGTAGSGIGKP